MKFDQHCSEAIRRKPPPISCSLCWMGHRLSVLSISSSFPEYSRFVYQPLVFWWDFSLLDVGKTSSQSQARLCTCWRAYDWKGWCCKENTNDVIARRSFLVIFTFSRYTLVVSRSPKSWLNTVLICSGSTLWYSLPHSTARNGVVWESSKSKKWNYCRFGWNSCKSAFFSQLWTSVAPILQRPITMLLHLL